MTDSFRIVRYTRAHRSAVLTFLRRAYAPNDSERLISQWDWKYDSNPLRRQDEPFVFLLQEDARVVGMLGTIPLCIAIEGNEFPILHSCDLVVEKAHRGRGLADRMIVAYLSANPVGFSWLNALSHRRALAHQRSEWRTLTPLIKPLAPLALARRSRSAAAHELTTTLVPDPPILSKRVLSDMTIEPIPSFDERYNDLWRKVRAEQRVICVRDAAFLNWRYVARPDVVYTILAATRGHEVLGYLVMRLGQQQGLRVGYFVDVLVREERQDVLGQLIKAGTASMRRYGAVAINCLVTPARWRWTFLRHGFLPWRWGAQPFFHLRSEKTDVQWTVFRNPQNWFLTMGDGDLEMSY